MIIKHSELIQIILILVAYFLCDSLLFRVFDLLIFGVAILLLAIVAIKYRRKIDIRIAFLIAFLILNTIFVRSRNGGGIGLFIVARWFFQIEIIWCAYCVCKNKFIINFVNVINFYAVTSIVMSLLYWVIPSIYLTLFPSFTIDYSRYPIKYIGFPILHIVSSWDTARNSGIFTEPGLFGMCLCISLYFLVIYKDHFNMSVSKYKSRLIVIIITLLLCRSTASILAATAIVSYSLIKGNFSKKTKMLIGFVLVVGFLGIDYLLNGTGSFVYSNILSKITTMSDVTSSGGQRMLVFEYVTNYMGENFWGGGIDGFLAYVYGINAYASIAANAFFISFAYYGIQFVIVYLLLFFSAWKNKIDIFQYLILIGVYLIFTFAQSNVLYPVLIIPFLICNDENKFKRRVAVND